MEGARPEVGQEINHGPVVVPRLAATVIVLRGGASGLEVLLAQRNPTMRFMGGAWVFPGGSVSADDGEGDRALRLAAARELAEEVDLVVADPDALVAFSRWITPAEVMMRFDTWFFLTPEPVGQEPRVDGSEMVDCAWYTPAAALAAARREEIMVVFPTRKHLEQLSSFACADALLDYARGQTVRPVQPRVVGSGEMARILLPGEPGYDAP